VVLRSWLTVEEDVVDEGLLLARWSMLPRGLPVIEVLLNEESSAFEEILSVREGLVYGEVLVG
jgi:hypothetical protein